MDMTRVEDSKTPDELANQSDFPEESSTNQSFPEEDDGEDVGGGGEAAIASSTPPAMSSWSNTPVLDYRNNNNDIDGGGAGGGGGGGRSQLRTPTNRSPTNMDNQSDDGDGRSHSSNSLPSSPSLKGTKLLQQYLSKSAQSTPSSPHVNILDELRKRTHSAVTVSSSSSYQHHYYHHQPHHEHSSTANNVITQFTKDDLSVMFTGIPSFPQKDVPLTSAGIFRPASPDRKSVPSTLIDARQYIEENRKNLVIKSEEKKERIKKSIFTNSDIVKVSDIRALDNTGRDEEAGGRAGGEATIGGAGGLSVGGGKSESLSETVSESHSEDSKHDEMEMDSIQEVVHYADNDQGNSNVTKDGISEDQTQGNEFQIVWQVVASLGINLIELKSIHGIFELRI